MGERTHNRLRSSQAPVGNHNALRENLLLDPVAEAVINSHLDLLDDHQDSTLVRELVLEVGLAEQIVELVVEAIVLVLDDQDLLCLLDNLLLEAVVDDLQVLLLDVDDLLLLVQAVEAVNEVEVVAEAVVAEALTRGEGSGFAAGVDGLGGWSES